MEFEKEMAVCVQDACKSYGKKEILNKLKMHVEKGTIYGLLGASGCGKTTLLKCIVGAAKLDSGKVWVLGASPGTKGSKVPGPAVGYMPQEIALIDEFTVKGAVYYFGRISGNSDEFVRDKYCKLSKLLDLPPSNRLVKDCSGGQQRRVSLAAALVGNPEILILDEPTVGLDPVIREQIWNYFLELVKNERITIIITTHYIEETRQANRIGLMRKGILLTENSPEELLRRFNTDSLEEVYLILSQKQAEDKLHEIPSNNILENINEISLVESVASSTNSIANGSQDLLKKPETQNTETVKRFNSNKMKALIGKNFNQIVKNLGGISFMLFFPCMEIFLFFLTIGNEVQDVKVAVINHEDNFGMCHNYVRNESAIPYNENECRFRQLGCRFIEQLQDPMLNLIFYNNAHKAIEGITHGDILGAIYIPQNFSTSLEERLSNGPFDTKEETLNASQIQVWLDTSERDMGIAVKIKLIRKIVELQKSVFADCNYMQKYGEIPLKFEEAVYGHHEDTLRVFITPGIILTIIFFLGATNTTPTIIADRLGGMWGRSVIAGVSSLEILITHFITQFAVIIVQTIIIIAITFAAFHTEYLGSFALIFIMVLLEGVCGMMYGFFISVCTPDLRVAHYATSGSFLPMMLLCGIIWPIEGMPAGLWYFSLCLPFTVPIISLRNVMKKGWSVLHKEVINGVAIEVAWIVILLIGSVLFLSRKK